MNLGDEYVDWGWYWRAQELTKVTVLDLSDRLAPAKVKELYLEGWYKTAREVEGRVRMVSYSWMNIPGVKTWLDTPESFWNTNDDSERERSLRDPSRNSGSKWAMTILSGSMISFQNSMSETIQPLPSTHSVKMNARISQCLTMERVEVLPRFFPRPSRR